VRDNKGQPSTAMLEIKYEKIRICLPIGKGKRYGNRKLTIIDATERRMPRGREPIEWKLVANLPVASSRGTRTA
jgi:hypothetical protein